MSEEQNYDYVLFLIQNWMFQKRNLFYNDSENWDRKYDIIINPDSW